MTEIVRSFCPQCGARDAAMVIPGVPFSVMCSKCGISMVRESGAPSLSPIPPTDFVQVPIEDVKPGDVARCNGREFRVMPTCEGSRRKWYVNLGSYQMADYDLSTIGALGFTFWRKVKREPRSFEVQPSSVDVEYDSSRMVSPVTKFQVTLPGAYWGLDVGQPNRYGTHQRELRVAKGITLRKFAESLGVSPTYVSGIENGTLPPPTAERIEDIARLLETSLDDLIELAGRWDDVARQAVDERPEFVRLFRAVKDLSEDQMNQLTKVAEELSGDDADPEV